MGKYVLHQCQGTVDVCYITRLNTYPRVEKGYSPGFLTHDPHTQTLVWWSFLRPVIGEGYHKLCADVHHTVVYM
jgi:hypothetical protein